MESTGGVLKRGIGERTRYLSRVHPKGLGGVVEIRRFRDTVSEEGEKKLPSLQEPMSRSAEYLVLSKSGRFYVSKPLRGREA